MANLTTRAILVVICGMAAEAVVADGSMRCGSKLIEVGMTQSAVLEHCGEPSSKSEEEIPVRSGNQVTGTTLSSRWTYESYGATRVLVFDQEKLVSIE
jgi:Protein of unknown function (DUF2845)